jgi:hypothetical protein
MKVMWLVLAGVLFGATPTAAQEACPGGTQVGQNCGGGYCVPICAYDESPQNAAPPPPRVVERWEVFDDRFGSIAIAPNGPYGVSFNEPTSATAEDVALKRCRERGGVGCNSRGFHVNSCSTFAWGEGTAATAGDSTREKSEAKALELCAGESRKKCDVIETVCSTPVSRWVYEKPPGWEPAER